jgi:hypothetical protein
MTDSPQASSAFSSGGWGCLLVALLCMPVVALVSYLYGGTVWQARAYQQLASEREYRIQAFFDKNPGRYGGLTIERASDHSTYLYGTVATPG